LSNNDVELFNDQVIRQYELEKETKYKKDLDFSPFEKAMKEISDERYQELDDYILEKPIKTIREHLNKKVFSAEELVLYFLKRIKKYGSKLNALIELNPGALNIAREIDSKLKDGNNLSPLAGIPIILKDNIGTSANMHTTAGAAVLENSMTNKDAPIVEKIKSLDGVILGKANLSEWAYYMSSDGVCGYSALGGQTKNPYGKFDVGGSSSGSGVSTAANLACAAVGTETCGSIIYPSSQNSVVGLKPTLGLLENKGIVPIAESLDTPGPMTKNIEDAALLTSLLTDKENLKSQNIDEILDINKKDFKIGIINNEKTKDYFRDEDSEILSKAKEDMEKIGFTVEYVEFEEKVFKVDIDTILQYEFKKSMKDYLEEYTDGDFPKSLVDIWEYNNEDIKKRAPYGQDLLQKSAFTKIDEDEYKEVIENDTKLCEAAINKKLEKYDALVSLSNHFSLVYALGGHPALTIPAGYRSSGEPIGLTFVGGHFQEEELFNIGYVYEQNTKYRKLPILENL